MKCSVHNECQKKSDARDSENYKPVNVLNKELMPPCVAEYMHDTDGRVGGDEINPTKAIAQKISANNFVSKVTS